MQVKLIPSLIGGTIIAPASKSAMQRACALALLHNGQTIVTNPGQSNDDKAALEIIQHLGAQVQQMSDDKLSITGNYSLDGFAPSGNGNSVQSEVKEGAGLNVYESYSSTINYSNENNEI